MNEKNKARKKCFRKFVKVCKSEVFRVEIRVGAFPKILTALELTMGVCMEGEHIFQNKYA